MQRGADEKRQEPGELEHVATPVDDITETSSTCVCVVGLVSPGGGGFGLQMGVTKELGAGFRSRGGSGLSAAAEASRWR